MLQRTEHALVSLARQTILHYLTTGEHLKPADEFPIIVQRPAGVFVSLKRHGELRGCIGTCVPMQPSLVQEIIHNAPPWPTHGFRRSRPMKWRI
jgi:AMMECR1 domain-containing protein